MRTIPGPVTLPEIDAAVIYAWDTALSFRLDGKNDAAEAVMRHIDRLLDQRLTTRAPIRLNPEGTQ